MSAGGADTGALRPSTASHSPAATATFLSTPLSLSSFLLHTSSSISLNVHAEIYKHSFINKHCSHTWQGIYRGKFPGQGRKIMVKMIVYKDIT
jgi:hypothetical protein